MKFKELPKFWKINVIVLSFITILLLSGFVAFQSFLNNYRNENEIIRAKCRKDDKELIGTRLEIPRNNKKSVKVNVYTPNNDNNDKLPVVFNIHGGGFVGGDADLLDTQSYRISNEWNVIVVAVNYTKADVKPMDYGVEEIVDTIKYFREHKEEYNVDVNKFVVMGYSAGAYYTAKTAIALDKQNIPLMAQVLCYPWTKSLPTEKISSTLAPAMFVWASEDPISQNSKTYERALNSSGVTTYLKEYQGAVHSFIESNNPEGSINITEDLESVINSEQEKLAREAENDIKEWISTLMNNN